MYRKCKGLKFVTAFLLLLALFVSDLGYIPGKEAKAAGEEQAQAETQESNDRSTINFNTDWLYKKGDVSGAETADYADESWGYVNLPHSTTFYTTENKDAYLGISWYRKHFTVDESLRGEKLLLTFEAVMQQADVYINGEFVMKHQGGYTPFVIDITDIVKYGEENVIALKTDSRASSSFAPGKDKPDFQYFGGMYGNSYITVTDKIHITDAVEAEETAGGGVFITAPAVSEESATLKVKTQVENEEDAEAQITLVTEILDDAGEVVASAEDSQAIGAAAAYNFQQEITVENPRLWSPDTPELYTVRSTVKADGVIQDTVDTTYGIRKVEWKRDGLYINGKEYDVEGANLHAETYMFGNAMPDNAIYEEVKRFKESGFDIMRMAHYPHRKAYYDACDKYGVMVLECPSGWQYFNDSDDFKESTYEELRTNIRYKRNHPCIVAWESSLNETGYTAEWARNMNAIVKEEIPSDGDVYAYTAGCYHWDEWDIGLSTPQAGIFTEGNEGAENPKYEDKPIIIAEYGDWTYGGSGSTTRVTREKENSTGNKGGDEGMLIQADNIQESVQTNRKLGENWLGASMYWDYADYAGFDTGLMTYCGVVDLYRIPKHGAYFYKSQRSADTDLSKYGLDSGPMVYIANTWDDSADTEVRIYTNCDTVELFLNGVSLGEKGHDDTIYGPHGDGNPQDYPQTGAGKEISADHLKNAPITFELDKYEAGELRAVAKIDGEAKAEYVRRTPGSAAAVQLRPESDAAVPLDGSSAKLVWIDIVDENGTVVTDAYTDVNLSVEGPGLVVGPKTITTKGGQLAVWVKSKRGSGDIVLTAESENLQTASVTIPTSQVEGLPEVPEGGDSDEYERVENEEENIFLNKSSRASTENTVTNEVTAKGNDGDYNTKWCASDGSYPQWWEVDLGAEFSLDTMSLAFETLGSTYYYTVAVSNEPMTDENYAEHIVLDNSNGSTDTELTFEDVKGRYVRITFTEASNGEWAVLRDVAGTGTSSNLALNKPVSASSVNQGAILERAEYAVDGDTSTHWCAVGGEGTTDHWLQVDLQDTYKLSEVKLMFEKDDAEYRFVLQGSVDGEHFRDIRDFRADEEGCGQNVTIPTDATVQYLRVYDISTKDPASQWPAIKELEVYGEKTDYILQSVSREKEASASSCREGTDPSYGSNGVPGYYWYPASLGEEWWCIDTKGIFDLDNIQMTWNLPEEHKYIIEISTDGETWTTVADRSETGTSDMRPYESVSGTARYIRVTLPEGRTTEQGFGLLDAYAPTPAGRSVAEIRTIEGIEAAEGTPFEELGLPQEIPVVLEDGIKTTLPVTWSEEGYTSGEGNVRTVTGSLSAIEGVILGEETEVSVEITLVEQPADTKDIKSVDHIEGVEVQFGTPVEDIKLPDTVSVVLENDEKAEVQVLWNTEAYDADAAGTYTLEGELVLPEGITNSSNLKAVMQITVLAKQTGTDDKPQGGDNDQDGSNGDKGNQNGNNNEDKSVPKTGDVNRVIFVYILAGLIISACAAGLSIKKRKTR